MPESKRDATQIPHERDCLIPDIFKVKHPKHTYKQILKIGYFEYLKQKATIGRIIKILVIKLNAKKDMCNLAKIKL